MRVDYLAFAIFYLLSVLPMTLDAQLVWPTPNQAFQNGEPVEAFVQPTSSGRVESGLFGCVRNGGAKFHEGLDLFPVERSARGEARDPVYAILPGRVVHVSEVSGHSSYGRYVVVQHDGEEPAFHSLYAHLASVNPGIRIGTRVEAGAPLGMMGRSAGGYSIPRSRAHLHLELGLKLSNDFQTWFDRLNVKSPNRHGNWNGMNLVSVDPLDFYRKVRDGEVSSFLEYLRRLPVAARIRVHSSKVPDFVREYPALLRRPYHERELVAWDIAFTQYGLPKEWVPRFVDERLGGQSGEVRVLAYDERLIGAQSCRQVIRLGGSVPTIAPGTVTTIRKLFGFK